MSMLQGCSELQETVRLVGELLQGNRHTQRAAVLAGQGAAGSPPVPLITVAASSSIAEVRSSTCVSRDMRSDLSCISSESICACVPDAAVYSVSSAAVVGLGVVIGAGRECPCHRADPVR